MPGRTRLYSEFIAQDSESADSCVTHISDPHISRIPVTRSVRGNVRALNVTPDFGLSSKRRKTMGLNSRFDRMMEHVNLTFQDPQTPSVIASSRQDRDRARSAGSSSVSSGYDIPKTPVDAYRGLGGRLGHSFSVIKMKSASGGKTGGYYREGGRYDESSYMQFEQPEQIDPIKIHKEPLPEWLSKTFSKLDPQNPLRLLIPQSTLPISETALLHEEPIFAFSHIPRDQHEGAAKNIAFEYQDPTNSALQELNPMNQQSHSTLPLPIYSPDPIVTNSGPEILHPMTLSSSDNEFLPLPDIDSLPLLFSTPGPNSAVSLALSHGDSRSALCAPAIKPAFPDENEILTPFSMPGPLTQSPIDLTSPALLHVQPKPDLQQNCVPALPSSPLSYDDLPIHSSNSDPPLPINVYKLPRIKNLFATPGPRFHVALSRPIYFDSPTEDPCDFDPLATPGGYELEDLDFRWEPFMRNDMDRDAEKVYGEWDSSLDFDVRKGTEDLMTTGFEVPRDIPDPASNEHQASVMYLDRNPSSPRCGPLPPYPQDSEAEPTITLEQKKIEPAFAPASRILISHDDPMAKENDVEILLEKPNSQISIPVTPKNKSTTPLGLLNTIRTQSRKATLKSRPKPNQTRSQTPSPSLPLPDVATSRSTDTTYGWQMTREAPKVSNVLESALRENSVKQGVSSQISNDSIESWSEENDGWG